MALCRGGKTQWSTRANHCQPNYRKVQVHFTEKLNPLYNRLWDPVVLKTVIHIMYNSWFYLFLFLLCFLIANFSQEVILHTMNKVQSQLSLSLPSSPSLSLLLSYFTSLFLRGVSSFLDAAPVFVLPSPLSLLLWPPFPLSQFSSLHCLLTISFLTLSSSLFVPFIHFSLPTHPSSSL